MTTPLRPDPPRIRPLPVLAKRIRVRRERLAQLVERHAPARVLALEAEVLLALMAEQAQRVGRLAAWTRLSAKGQTP